MAPLTRSTPVPFEISFSEPVTGFDDSKISINLGSITNFRSTDHSSLSFDGTDDYVEVPSQSTATSFFDEHISIAMKVKVTGGSGSNRNIDQCSNVPRRLCGRGYARK